MNKCIDDTDEKQMPMTKSMIANEWHAWMPMTKKQMPMTKACMQLNEWMNKWMTEWKLMSRCMNANDKKLECNWIPEDWRQIHE